MKAEITLGALYFEREGEGRDIYIIHGSPGDARFMRGMLEPAFETKGGWRRTYLELPGFGKSTANKVFDSHDMMLEFVLESVDHLSAGRPYALLGYSYGAYLAQGALIKKSNPLRGLCLIAPRMMQDPSLKTVPERRVIDEDEEFSRDLTEDEAWLSEFVVMQSLENLHRMRDNSQSCLANFDQQFVSMLSESAPGLSFAVDDLSKPFERPALILCGRQDNIVGYRDPWPILEAYPRATYAVLDAAGHFVGLIERRELFESLVGDWLDRMGAEEW